MPTEGPVRRRRYWRYDRATMAMSKHSQTGSSNVTEKAPWRKSRDAATRKRQEQRWARKAEVSVKFGCPVCGGPHPRADHPAHTELGPATTRPPLGLTSHPAYAAGHDDERRQVHRVRHERHARQHRRPRITCSHRCRQEAHRRRHPLGWKMLAELDLPDRSPLEM